MHINQDGAYNPNILNDDSGKALYQEPFHFQLGEAMLN